MRSDEGGDSRITRTANLGKRRTLETNSTQRTIGFHPCIGTKASGEERPTSVVIRTSDGKHVEYEFGEQQLLDFFTCGAVLGWREATLEDMAVERPLHHIKWEETTKEIYEACISSDPAALDDERSELFRLKYKRRSTEVIGWRRAHVPTGLVTLDPSSDSIGVANGGLGFQIMEILLGRYPDMDMRVIGSGTLKEHRPQLDQLLPKALQKKASKARETAEAKDGTPPESGVTDEVADEDEADEAMSKSAAKDANAKFDAHRIAYALAETESAKLFHRCTLRDRDWAAANIAYGLLETARKTRVAAEQQFRQAHRIELRRLVKDLRVPFVTLSSADDDESQTIESLLKAYEAALQTCGHSDKVISKKMEVLRQSYSRIEGARTHEEEMDKNLEHALGGLPEYTEFLARIKAKVHGESGLPLGKYIGERIFGRWIAGFGSPMSSRLDQPIRLDDQEKLVDCRANLSIAITALDRSGLPEQPAIGGGRTREWILTCERIVTQRFTEASEDERARLQPQLDQVKACHDAYRALTRTKKAAGNRPLNRVIAFMGLHVKNGGKYEGTPENLQFPRRRKGGRANWNEQMLRQGAYQWGTLIIKGKDSHWKAHVYLPYKEKLIAGGMKKGHAHKRAFWRMTTVAVRWLINEWFSWERNRPAVLPDHEQAAA